MNLQEDALPVCLSTSITDENVKVVKKIIMQNRRGVIRKIAWANQYVEQPVMYIEPQ